MCSAVSTRGRDSELCCFLPSFKYCVKHGRAEAVGVNWDTVEPSGPNTGEMLLVLFSPTHTVVFFVTWHLTVSVISLGE